VLTPLGADLGEAGIQHGTPIGVAACWVFGQHLHGSRISQRLCTQVLAGIGPASDEGGQQAVNDAGEAFFTASGSTGARPAPRIAPDRLRLRQTGHPVFAAGGCAA
jgi:hypothetical protein